MFVSFMRDYPKFSEKRPYSGLCRSNRSPFNHDQLVWLLFFNDTLSVYFSCKLGTVYHIAKEEGVSALWRGIQTSFFLSANPAIQFMVYETIKHFVQIFKTDKLGKMKVLSSPSLIFLGINLIICFQPIQFTKV